MLVGKVSKPSDSAISRAKPATSKRRTVTSSIDRVAVSQPSGQTSRYSPLNFLISWMHVRPGEVDLTDP
ncbi:MAG TPA: hypothetical protein PLM77_18795, partial [Phycisphaerae bacterium]|nr:hypothetical protein [Phycisphaerae bacterium]